MTASTEQARREQNDGTTEDSAPRGGEAGSPVRDDLDQIQQPREEPVEKTREKDENVIEGSKSERQDTQATDHSGNADLEAARTASSTAPPYTVFSKGQKRFIVFMVAFGGTFSPLSTNIYFPALPNIQAAEHVSAQLINLTITVYMIFQGLSPTVFGDLADMGGRRPAYLIAFLVYLAANIGLALQNSYAALMVLRCIQSSGSSGTIALASGVVADIASTSERGTYMGLAMMGPMIGPSFAPLIGGILAQYLGWRSIFWFLVIAGGVYLIPLALFFPETGRNVVGNGSVHPPPWNMSFLNYVNLRKARRRASGSSSLDLRGTEAQRELASKRKLRFPNPLKTIDIVLEKDVGVILLFSALLYTAFYSVTVTLPSIFQDIYQFNNLQLGLCYLPLGVGCGVAVIVTGKLTDWNYRRVAAQHGVTIDRRRNLDIRDFPIEKARVQVMYPMVYITCATTLSYGWVLFAKTNLAAPLILQFIIGLSVTGAFNVLTVLLVDLYPQSPATATAANNLVRCVIGAGGTAVIDPMINAMGVGWCFTFISLVCAIFSPCLWVVTRYGPQWREQRRIRLLKREDKKVAAEKAKETKQKGGEEERKQRKEQEKPESKEHS